MRITHLHHESRASLGISQGILQLDHKLHSNRDVYVKGELLYKRSESIFEDLKNCDVILINDSEFFSEFIERHHLWGKSIFYDYRDSLEVKQVPLQKCCTYFKRSLLEGRRRKPISTKQIRPIQHCALNEYYVEDVPRIYDIGCFFELSNPNIGFRRRNITEHLLEKELKNCLIGKSTAHGQKARLAITNQTVNNPFYDFLNLQKQCKIIFTAQPEPVEGDNRTWEAFATGSLVFRDVFYGYVPDVPRDGEHCVVYDASDRTSISKAIQKAEYYLRHDLEREEIAQSGYNHVLKYHRPINRVNLLISPITKLL
jgi:hypothetical protein